MRATESLIRPRFVVAFAPMNTLTIKKPKAASDANENTQSIHGMTAA